MHTPLSASYSQRPQAVSFRFVWPLERECDDADLGTEVIRVLLTNFTDSANPKPFSLAQAQDAWATIRRFWQYDSYDKVSLSGSQVFDWQTYPSTQAAFTAAHTDADGAHRGTMIAAVKTALGVDTTKFDHFIIIFSEAVGDAWTEGSGSIFEPTIMATSTICHEMTHQFGESDHSWDRTHRVTGGAKGEYYDQTDIMSAQNCWVAKQTAADPFSGSGPHHCMFWKDKFGWLDGATITRIRDADLENGYDQTFTLFSRNEPVLERLNCIQFLDIWVELDVNTDKGGNVFYDDFDTGLQGSGVVIHKKRTVPSGNTVPVILVPDLTNNPDQKFWSAGQIFTRIKNAPQSLVDVYVWVQSVDVVEGSATVNISSTYPRPLTRHKIVRIRKAHSTAGGHGGFDYISHVGIINDFGGIVPLSRSNVVAWIESKRNSFYVQGSDASEAEVVVEQHWIKTDPDSNPADNLLSLPTF